MRERLTKTAMGKNDCPTTMDVEKENSKVEKYDIGGPSEFAEDPDMSRPWEKEKRNEVGLPAKSPRSAYASAVREAKELEEKAVRCLKMAEVVLGEETPADAVEKQACDFMTMSNKSVLSTLRRMREFEENISEIKVGKIVDAVMEVISEEEKEEEEVKEEKEAAVEEKEEEKEEEVKEASMEVSFDELGDVTASKEDVALLSQLFTAKEDNTSTKKESKVQTLKNVTASKNTKDEISQLSALWDTKL